MRIPVTSQSDIDPRYRGTPVEQLLLLHNLGTPVAGAGGELIVVTCMDCRVNLALEGLRAFQVRTAGATPMPVLSNIAYARAAADIDTICVIGHTDCAMCRVTETRQLFAESLMRRDSWSREDAYALADELADECGIDEPAHATVFYAQWLRERMTSCLVAPLLYDVESRALEQLAWSEDERVTSPRPPREHA